MGPPKSKKVRIRWLSGDYEGLEEWVPQGRLVAPWDEADALLKDEERLLLAYEASQEAEGSLQYEAVALALEHVDFGWREKERALLRVEDLADAARALRMQPEDLLAEPLAFVDRHGVYWAPFATAQRIALVLCRQDPQRVLAKVQKEEEALRETLVTGIYRSPFSGDAWDASREWAEEEIAQKMPVRALVREWCGADAQAEFNERMALRAEVSRLRDLVKDLAHWLREQGHPVKAALVLKDLERSDTLKHK